MNLNTALTALIAKGALRATRKPIATLRRDVSDLKRQVAELKRLVRGLQKAAQHKAVEAPAPETESGKTVRIRPTGPMVRKLRKKLGLTQIEMAKLINVSSLSVSHWELSPGRLRLRQRTLAALAGVRGMGKREAKKALAEGVDR